VSTEGYRRFRGQASLAAWGRRRADAEEIAQCLAEQAARESPPACEPTGFYQQQLFDGTWEMVADIWLCLDGDWITICDLMQRGRIIRQHGKCYRWQAAEAAPLAA